jgi:NAD(P)-dependent dehydrogenase (short-subunit alcohol dehydrogenase family)
MRLRGRTAILVGASGGIGAATVDAFVKAGANLVLAAPESERDRLQELAQGARAAAAEATVVPTDVRNRGDIDVLAATALATYGRIDVLAYIAGIGSSPALADDTDEQIERVIGVNLLGCARAIHAVLPAMKAQRNGAIVVIGSIAGEVGIMGAYSASKFGVRGLCDTVRREVRSDNVRVTLIEPGFVRTPMNAAMGDGLPPPSIVADAIVDAVLHPRRVRIVPKRYIVPAAMARMFPGLFDLIFGDARIQRRLNRDARAEREAKAPR